jgi:hypothetical protein
MKNRANAADSSVPLKEIEEGIPGSSPSRSGKRHKSAESVFLNGASARSPMEKHSQWQVEATEFREPDPFGGNLSYFVDGDGAVCWISREIEPIDSVCPFQPFQPFQPSLTPDQEREYILLHELGHLTGSTRQQIDTNDDFNKLILSDCLGIVLKK